MHESNCYNNKNRFADYNHNARTAKAGGTKAKTKREAERKREALIQRERQIAEKFEEWAFEGEEVRYPYKQKLTSPSKQLRDLSN